MTADKKHVKSYYHRIDIVIMSTTTGALPYPSKACTCRDAYHRMCKKYFC